MNEQWFFDLTMTYTHFMAPESSQGIIKLRNTGDFLVANEGKRPIYVDGKPVLAGNKTKLNNNSVVEIASLRFIFLINLDLINVIRQETAKLSGH